MGQKLNPTIFRLGVNKTWKTEFFEKKSCELPLYIFKDLEIKNYIERFLETNGIILYDYKQHYNNSTLNLYISYFVTHDFILTQKKIIERIIIVDVAGEKRVVKKFQEEGHFSYQVVNLSEKKLDDSSFNFSRLYKIKQYLRMNSRMQVPSIYLKQSFKPRNNKYLKKTSRSSHSLKVEGVFEQFFAILNLFFGKQLNIVANFCCANKNTQFFKSTQQKTFVSFQKFKNTPFFKEGIELLFNVTYSANSASLLAKFIASQFKKVKRHKFLLSFLKQTLNTLLTSNLSKIKGIKIIVKGRLNGVPRAKHKMIVIGDVPVQTISAKLDYSQATVHNSNGSYGIKVWVVEK